MRLSKCKTKIFTKAPLCFPSFSFPVELPSNKIYMKNGHCVFSTALRKTYFNYTEYSVEINHIGFATW